MQKLRFDVEIDAPVAKVWNAMFDDASYRDWSSAFMPGSHYVGDWSEGSRILFLAPTPEGEAGLASRIRENRHHQFVSMEHVALVANGREDSTSETAAAWAGAREDYSFREVGGRTELVVQLDCADDHVDSMRGMWPRALDRLKELAES